MMETDDIQAGTKGKHFVFLTGKGNMPRYRTGPGATSFKTAVSTSSDLNGSAIGTGAVTFFTRQT